MRFDGGRSPGIGNRESGIFGGSIPHSRFPIPCYFTSTVAPKEVKTGVGKDEAAQVKSKLEAAGATVEVK